MDDTLIETLAVRPPAVARMLCDRDASPAVIAFGACYARARCFTAGLGELASGAAELAVDLDPFAADAAQRLTEVERDAVTAAVDEFWEQQYPQELVLSVSELLARAAITPEIAGQAAREMSFDHNGWTPATLYLGALAEAKVAGVPVSDVILGRPELLLAKAEAEMAKANGFAGPDDLEGWLFHPAVWNEVMERAVVLTQVEAIGAEVGA
ncbi:MULTISPECIES: hypothetical protein [Mycolicibacterium]|uniref:hypothetical protein n=1 Tax=Mycolicibacterium TaxID=1866885 RepID=UPI0007EA1060|nr:hypothetical protein [Mycolicibacterium fortuitum]OBG24067.1 hypothetical protein A5768_22090 [Mycolicibacterium fortuitum]